MTRTKKHMLLWFAAGTVFSLLVLLVVWTGLSGKVWITDPEGIPKSADAVMNCIHTGNWTSLEEMVIGSPTLHPDTGEADSVENMIWEAYRKSLQWTCAEEIGIQDSYVTQRITITCLDIDSTTKVIAHYLADSASESAHWKGQDSLLRIAAKQVLESEAPVMQREITLTFQREQGRWMLVPNKTLQTLLSGFVIH